MMAFGHEDAAAPIGAASFTKASNTMDTEKKMQEYIESELQRRRTAGIQRVESTSNDSLDSAESKGEAAAGPDFGIEQKPVAEGNVSFSAAMLTSIPVVDLGISTKLKNIEETEKAKREIMDRKKETRDNIDKIGGSLNFAASDRYYKNKPHPHDKKKKEAEDGDKRRREEPGKPKFDRRTMATDDLVMEKFKKRNQGGRR
ncbi:hepatocellular carcinoma-associated antigen 59-domain-containing protein [Chytriomyces sp. MP71]|nr:hepatocellular carcinoma-associated antigen 59-domain-containing protein [Chytriomyces sp. MP71]